jgi:hypothetical protein
MLSIVMDFSDSGNVVETCGRCGRDRDDHVGNVCVERDHKAAVRLPWSLQSVQLSGAIERRRIGRHLSMESPALE